MNDPASSREASRRADATDPVPSLRDRFELPRVADGSPAIYLAGHSLGPLPRAARDDVEAELDAWSRLGVEAWFRERDPWLATAESFAEPTARLVGARPSEIVTMSSLTVNIHLLLASVYRPTRERYRILIEAGAFPSDRYAVTSQLVHHGVDPADGVVLARPRPGEVSSRSEDVEALIEQERERLALVWLPGVQYVTGQVLDIERLTAAGRAAGAVVGWDLAHAAGNVPLRLHDWGVDVAAWCTYKYLNAGPGSVGQAFVHERWHGDTGVPRLAGWWGSDPDARFAMPDAQVPAAGAAAWQVSTPSILSMIPLRASLALFDEVGLERLRQRSMRMTAHLQRLIDTIDGVETVTPRDTAERGAMLNLRVPHRSAEVQRRLADRGVIVDFREPDVFRLTLPPLYATYEEAWRLSEHLGAVVGELA